MKEKNRGCDREIRGRLSVEKRETKRRKKS